MKDQAADVENTLRTAGFSRPVVSTEQIPAKQKEELEEQIRKIEQTIADIRGEIISYAEDREELKIIGDYYRMRAEKYEVLGTLPQSRRTFIISGYAAKEAIPAIQKGIGDAYDCVIDVEELKEDEEPPVILKNNGFSESVEGVLESYGLPHKGEIDPTAIMSFFYVFFFGMMLSDAAYGAIIEIYENVHVLWNFYHGMGNLIRWIFRRCRRRRIEHILWKRTDDQAAVVCTVK